MYSVPSRSLHCVHMAVREINDMSAPYILLQGENVTHVSCVSDGVLSENAYECRGTH